MVRIAKGVAPWQSVKAGKGMPRVPINVTATFDAENSRWVSRGRGKARRGTTAKDSGGSALVTGSADGGGTPREGEVREADYQEAVYGMQLVPEEVPPELFDPFDAEQEVADEFWGFRDVDDLVQRRSANMSGGGANICRGAGDTASEDHDTSGGGKRSVGSYQWGGSSGSGGGPQCGAEAARKRARTQGIEDRRQLRRDREHEASAIADIAGRLAAGPGTGRRRLEELARRVRARIEQGYGVASGQAAGTGESV